jgi:hypothetical protein
VYPIISTGGATWTRSSTNVFQGWNVDYSGVTQGANGSKGFVNFARDVAGGNEAAFSTDLGKTWTRRVINGSCPRRVISGNNVTLFAGGGTQYCRTTDHGATVQVYNAPSGANILRVVHTGTEFVAFASNSVYRSTDGISWSAQNMNFSGSGIGGLNEPNIAYDPVLKVYVSVYQGWNGWYEKEKWVRSVDGVNWTAASNPTSATTGHPSATSQQVRCQRVPANNGQA